MSLRVTQRTMYNQFVNQMQTNLSAYMDSNIQGSSQKKINRPSDDPAGTALVLNYRHTISNTEQLQRNVDTAKGWLNLSDSTLNEVSTTIIAIKALAQEANTSPMSPENRLQIGVQVRELFGQLLNLSNKQFEGKSIYAGHKYDENAFEEGLFATSADPNLAGAKFEVTGKSKSTIMLSFDSSGTVGGASPLTYKWTDQWPNDGDTSKWNTGTLVAGSNVIGAGGVQLTIPTGTVITAADPTQPTGSKNGTAVYIRPAAYYQGDDNDPPPTVETSGKSTIAPGMSAKGTFGGKTLLRIDDSSNLSSVQYSYSVNNGASWVTATAPVNAVTGDMRMLMPGGYLDLNFGPSPSAGNVIAGQQFTIRPHEADLNYEIMNGGYVSVTGVGKDIFGGLYKGTGATTATPVFSDSERNLFEIVGNLIGWCETNNQEGIQQCFGAIEEAHKNVLNEAARVGGKENRLSLAKDVLSFQKLDQQERLSYTEDVDLTELLTRMAQQQLAYNTVLKSSSMIMQLNLTKFV